MDSEDDIYDSHDGEYSEDYDEEDYFEEVDEDEGVSEDYSEEVDEDEGVLEDDLDEVVLEENEENGDVLEESEEDGDVSDYNGEDGDVLEESEDGEDGDYGFVDNVVDDDDVLDFSSCHPQVDGDIGNQYKSFSSSSEAEDYVTHDREASETVSEKQVDGYIENQYKSFSSSSEAEDYIAHDREASEIVSGKQGRYTLEFDGASKGNPGKSGAGAVIRSPDGSVAHKIMKGIGVATNNAAEYEALNEGLKYAKSQGIDRIQVKGDSNLVCKQVNGDWKTRSKNLVDLNMEAKNLKSHFKEFHIDYVPRASNSEADALANDAVNLPDGKCVSH